MNSPSPYRVRLQPTAEREIRALEGRERAQVLKAIRKLETDPLRGKALQGPLLGRRSLRVGRFRVIYVFDSKAKVVAVLAVGDRRDVYRR